MPMEKRFSGLQILSCCKSIFWFSSCKPTTLYVQGPTGQGQLEKVTEFEWSAKGQGKIFFGKVRENEKLVPPYVVFSG